MAFIRPSFMDNMSWEMAEVYGAITDQILINLSRYFPYFKAGNVPKSAFEYQANMLAQMGQVNADTIRIIRNGLGGANKALSHCLEQAIIESVKKSQPDLLKAVQAGILKPAGIPIVAPTQMRAFSLYYQQAAQKLNLVNTVMLESTKQAYQATVADIANRVQVVQTALDIGAGETITGVSTWNQALRHSINRMKENGVVGFIDHGGHRWSAEAYTAMDIRTTVANTARAAVWETNQDFGNDLYIVSYHDGARPLCYDWQNKVISSTNNARTVRDLDGNEIQVYAQSDTTYGEPAGLFGINCKHYPSPFIPGVSVLYDSSEIPSEKENEKIYEQTQQQRGLERKLREEKRDLLMAKEMGADADEIKALRAKCRETSDDIDKFCEETGLPRRQNREGVFTQRSFPDKDTYDPATFERQQKETIDKYFSNGGTQQGYTFGQMTPKAPIPTPVPQAPAPVAQNVAPQVTQPQQKSNMIKMFERNGATPLEFKPLDKPLTEEEIITKISGADKTKGSCASVGLAYAGNKAGYDVRDFRGGANQYVISRSDTLRQVAQFPGIDGVVVKGGNDFTIAHELLTHVEEGKEYFFTAGKHAAIVRKTANGFEYLEMQSGYRPNTWYALNDHELRYRFGCQKSHTSYGMKLEVSDTIFDIARVKGNPQFEEVLQYVNTAESAQRKGLGGGEK